ncbi:MAG: cupin domain-containing protein, partial [Kiritimatiellae bacterium]|nr:cupin domain-containing protein [Kiritimatiellia bacterium]
TSWSMWEKRTMHNQRDQIARRLRALREDAAIETDEIEKRTGIAREDYLRYEDGSLDVPMGRVAQLAACFGVDEAVLLTGGDAHAHRFHVTRKGRGPVIARRAEYHYEALGVGFAGKKMDPFVVTVEPDSPPPILHTHSGQEFNYVLHGHLQFRIGGQTLTLGPGDSVYFDASQAHSMQALMDRPATFLAIVAD